MVRMAERRGERMTDCRKCKHLTPEKYYWKCAKDPKEICGRIYVAGLRDTDCKWFEEKKEEVEE